MLRKNLRLIQTRIVRILASAMLATCGALAICTLTILAHCAGPLHSQSAQDAGTQEPGYVEGEIEPDGIDASDEPDEPEALEPPEKFPGGVFQHDGDIRIRTSQDGLRIAGGYDSAIGGHLPNGEAQFTCKFRFVGKQVAPTQYRLLAYVAGKAEVRRGQLQVLGPRYGGSELLR